MPLRSLALAALAALLSARPALAEEPAEERPGWQALNLVAGMGLVAADRQRDVQVPGSGAGLLVSGEYVLWPTSWFSPRAYGGLLLTWPARACGEGVQPCDVSAKLVYGGGKARFTLPTPWVAPFFEAGLGVSLGEFRTRSGSLVDLYYLGPAYHVPVTAGVAFGARRQLEVALVYLYHPAQAQFSGGVVLGWQLDL
jgi:hypothetical protein